jgi:hypothetical protein
MNPMTLTLDLPPDLEARLKAEAGRRGLSAAEYLLEIARSATSVDRRLRRRTAGYPLHLQRQALPCDRWPRNRATVPTLGFIHHRPWRGGRQAGQPSGLLLPQQIPGAPRPTWRSANQRRTPGG